MAHTYTIIPLTLVRPYCIKKCGSSILVFKKNIKYEILIIGIFGFCALFYPCF